MDVDERVPVVAEGSGRPVRNPPHHSGPGAYIDLESYDFARLEDRVLLMMDDDMYEFNEDQKISTATPLAIDEGNTDPYGHLNRKQRRTEMAKVRKMMRRRG